MILIKYSLVHKYLDGDVILHMILGSDDIFNSPSIFIGSKVIGLNSSFMARSSLR